jgi:hypothetical protein
MFTRTKFRNLHWLLLALLIKVISFTFFAAEFAHNEAYSVIRGLFVMAGDTPGYYEPAEDFVNGYGYTSVCRMPGIVPIYGFLRFFGAPDIAKMLVILLQLAVSSFSVLCLARLASAAFPLKHIFPLTFFIYAVSSFTGIWDHYGTSDSFSISFLIFSVWFLYRWNGDGRRRDLLLSGFFMAWSVFFRPVNGCVLPLMCLVIFLRQGINRASLRSIVVLAIVPALGITSHTVATYMNTGRTVILQAPLDECYPAATPTEMLHVRKLIQAWGGDILAWNQGSEGMWFFTTAHSGKLSGLNTEGRLAPGYNGDSLVKLRNNYLQAVSLPQESPQRASLRAEIKRQSQAYTESYREQYPLKFYLINRLNLIRKFLFPKRLDYLPFPPLAEMSLLQKAVKGGYLVLLYLVSLFFIAGTIFALAKKNIFPVFPLAFIVLQAAILGYIELRYLTPAYPFMVILAAYAVLRGLKAFRGRSRLSSPPQVPPQP